MALTREQLASRLKELRQGLGFTQAQVADSLGMHRPTVSEIEAGRRAVTSEELYQFAQLYATTVSALLSEPTPEPEQVASVLFRRQGLDTPTAKTAVLRFMERCRAEGELENSLGLSRPPEARPGYRVDRPISTWDAVNQGNSIAEQERQRLGVGTRPIRSPLDLLEQQGVRIGPIMALAEDGIDGLYFESTDLGACVGVNPDRDHWTGFRASFTAAHEYAHWLLRDVGVEIFAFEPGTEDLIEVRANAFAASFLMPAAGITEYFNSAGLLRQNRIWHLSPADVVRAMDYLGVSRQALLYRLANLKLISRPPDELRSFSVRDTAAALGITFGARTYVGTRLPSLAIQAWRRGLIGASRAAELCDMDLQAFKTLVQKIGEEPEGYDGTAVLGAAAEG